ncbi:MAG: hypothetical protein HY692_09110 [Cyanobacteria bacterium NC_groundwater_1444_Ag_S-0.65um_54_12]|nr:hypothetical protein [Cyanobacteria bacterium NC_groundwater_1444_Ag_S-0.65um_54_12]
MVIATKTADEACRIARSKLKANSHGDVHPIDPPTPFYDADKRLISPQVIDHLNRARAASELTCGEPGHRGAIFPDQNHISFPESELQYAIMKSGNAAELREIARITDRDFNDMNKQSKEDRIRSALGRAYDLSANDNERAKARRLHKKLDPDGPDPADYSSRYSRVSGEGLSGIFGKAMFGIAGFFLTIGSIFSPGSIMR